MYGPARAPIANEASNTGKRRTFQDVWGGAAVRFRRRPKARAECAPNRRRMLRPGRRRMLRPGKEKGRREEVPAFSYIGPAGGSAGRSPERRREEVPPFRYFRSTERVRR